MKIDVLLSNDFPEESGSKMLPNSICLVIDVIRATSTITAALGSGAEKVIIAQSREDAFAIKKAFENTILCGEDRGIKIEGFDYDNSPLTLSKEDLRGRSAVLKTSNGTKSIIRAQEAKEVLALSILNLHHALDYALSSALKEKTDLLFLCSGEYGELSYDDAYVAGLGISYLMKKRMRFELEDRAELVLNAASHESDVYSALVKSRSGKYALALGLGDDIRFCTQLNRYRVAGKLEVDRSCSQSERLLILKPC